MLLVNKPAGWTSFDVVNKIRGAIRKKLGIKKIKVGHAGTLDPFATGLLIIGTGKKTTALGTLTDQDKTYTGVIKLGATTPTLDPESQESEKFEVAHITPEKIHQSAELFIGKQQQLPPDFSALKIGGIPSYKLARKGKKPELAPREIMIYDFKILEVIQKTGEVLIRFEIKCGKGTYIRAIARDFGKKLGSGGYLLKLERTGAGGYSLNNSHEIPDLIKIIENS